MRTDDHDCMEFRERVVLNEGDDAYVERCRRCGKVRMERGDGERPMAWYSLPPGAPWPWRYVYDDPRPGRDGDPEIWKPLAPEPDTTTTTGETP